MNAYKKLVEFFHDATAKEVTLNMRANSDGYEPMNTDEIRTFNAKIKTLDTTLFASQDYGDRIVITRLAPLNPDNLYEKGVPDARVDTTAAQQASAKGNPFRPKYRKLTDEEMQLHDDIKRDAMALLTTIRKVKPGRYRSLSVTALEEAAMWAVKELTS